MSTAPCSPLPHVAVPRRHRLLPHPLHLAAHWHPLGGCDCRLWHLAYYQQLQVGVIGAGFAGMPCCVGRHLSVRVAHKWMHGRIHDASRRSSSTTSASAHVRRIAGAVRATTPVHHVTPSSKHGGTPVRSSSTSLKLLPLLWGTKHVPHPNLVPSLFFTCQACWLVALLESLTL